MPSIEKTGGLWDLSLDTDAPSVYNDYDMCIVMYKTYVFVILVM